MCLITSSVEELGTVVANSLTGIYFGNKVFMGDKLSDPSSSFVVT